MSTSVTPSTAHPQVSEPATLRATRVLRVAASATGAALLAEAVVSLPVDSHVGYHALNAVLNAALLVSCVVLAVSGRRAVGLAGVLGGWSTALTALLASAGGAVVLLVEGLGSGETSDVVEGIAHTAVLASFLFMVALGVGARRVSRRAGYTIALSSASLVAMVLAGLDQPEVFLVPEAALGLGWLALARSLVELPGAAAQR